MPSDRLDPIEPTLPGGVARVGPVVMTPAERDEARRRREQARDERRRRDGAGAPPEPPAADDGEHPHIDVRG